jgi:hypothetical protein
MDILDPSEKNTFVCLRGGDAAQQTHNYEF